MQRDQAKEITITGGFAQRLSDFGVLVKFKLTLLVLFSALMSYAIVSLEQFNWTAFCLLGIGGFLVTGAANALNQVLERDYDILMPRTMNRPVATGRMSVSTAVLWAGLMALGGISCLSVFNPLTGFLGTLSLISYAFIYTPLKRNTPWAVAVGAVPGALPLIIGCTAHEGYVSDSALLLFLLQFLWQFPHFWAVAWIADEGYKKAGFYLLPAQNGEKNEWTGLLSFVFCLLLVGSAWWGFALGFTGLIATALLTALNVYWAMACWRLYRDCSQPAARKQMFISFMHLPVSLMVILADRMF